MQRASPQTGRRLDIFFLCCLAGGAFWYIIQPASLASWHWDMPALLRAICRMEATGHGTTLILGPLGTGMINTLRIIGWTMFFTFFYALFLAVCASSKKQFVYVAAHTTIAITRNLPPLVLVFIVHFFLAGFIIQSIDFSALTQLPLMQYLLPAPSKLPTFISAIFTLSLYEGSYIASIFAGSINTVHKQQWEAAASLGLSRWQQLHLIIMPQALRYAIAPLTGQTISLIKNSAIVSVISVQELTFQGLEYMTSSGLTLEIWTTITLSYLFLCLLISAIGRYLERLPRW